MGNNAGYNDGELLSVDEISVDERLLVGLSRGRRKQRAVFTINGSEASRDESPRPNGTLERRRRSNSPARLAARAKPKGRAGTSFGPRSTQWAFTLNNYTEAEVHRIQDLVNLDHKVTYLIFQPERGEEGTPHIQGYICFEVRKYMSTVKNAFGTQRLHLEVVRGSPSQNKLYCSDPAKRDIQAAFGLFEWGEIPINHNSAGKSIKLLEVKKLIDEGNDMWEVAKDIPEYFSIVANNYRSKKANQQVPRKLPKNANAKKRTPNRTYRLLGRLRVI